MKNIFKGLLFGSMIVMGICASGCSDDTDDEITEISLSRVLSPINIKQEVTKGCNLDLEWSPMKNAGSYVVELCMDTFCTELFRTIETEVNSIKEALPNTEARYYARVMAISNKDGIADSKWGYLVNDSIITETYYTPLTLTVAKAYYTSVDLTWDGTEDVDLVSKIKIGDVDYEVTAEEAAAKAKTIEGLVEDTKYTATIYYNKTKRGNVEFTTKSTKSITVTTSAEMFDAVENVNEGGTILVANDMTLMNEAGDDYKAIIFTKGVTIKADDEATTTPTITLGSQWQFSTAEAAGAVKIQNLNISVEKTQYLFNVASSNLFDIAGLEIENCTISFTADNGRSLIRTQASAGQKIGYIKFNNLIVNNASQSGQNYGAIHMGGATKSELPSQIDITNCTFNNIHSLVQFAKLTATSGAEASTVNVANCTFYNIFAEGHSSVRYLVELTSAGKSVAEDVLNITNCIFAKTNAASDGTLHNAVRANSINIVNSFMTSDTQFNELFPMTGATSLSESSAAVYPSAATGDFTLTNATLISAGAGDSRWIK